MSETHVIVGAGAAGLAAIRALRRRDREGRVVLVSAESGPSYSPALLPYLVAGKIEESELFLADRRFFAAHGVDTRLGVRAVGCDLEHRQVLLEPGGSLEYTKLLVASGASARGQSVPGVAEAGGLSGVGAPLTLRTLDDARILRLRILDAGSVVVLGAGLAGLEIATAARALGRRVTVVAASAQVLSRNASLVDAAVVQGWLEEAGVRFLLGRSVEGVEPGASGPMLRTAEGDTVPADLLVAAKGAVPSAGWVAGSGAGRAAEEGPEVDAGLAVDAGMRTSWPDVFAAGDTTRNLHAVTGRIEAFATWPSACAEGAVAGANMAGAAVSLGGQVPFNVLPVFRQRVTFLGCTTPEALSAVGPGVEEVVRGRHSEARGFRLWHREGRIVGAVVFGTLSGIGGLRSAIERGDIFPSGRGVGSAVGTLLSRGLLRATR